MTAEQDQRVTSAGKALTIHNGYGRFRAQGNL